MSLLPGISDCLKASFLACLFISSTANAQQCATYQYIQKNPVTNLEPNHNSRVNNLRDTLPNEVISIPVVVHVLYNNATENITDAQILSQIQVLNDDYRHLNIDASNTPGVFSIFPADSRIRFCLAKNDPAGKTTNGIIRKFTKSQSWPADDGMKFSAQGGDNAWDSKRYLNIWVCNLTGKSLGYSTVPGSEADKDGVVIEYTAFGNTGAVSYPFNKGRTATHEVGHWLGLKHLWGDAVCGDDGIFDTPTQQTYNNGCPSFPHTSSCSNNRNGDMFMNFMDFTDDACMNMFTKGQAVKMRSQFALNGARNSFLYASACDTVKAENARMITEVKEKISVYPNPAARFIIFESNTGVNNRSFSIFNCNGKQIASGLMVQGKNTIAVANLPAGIYLLKIAGQESTFKFLKQ